MEGRMERSIPGVGIVYAKHRPLPYWSCRVIDIFRVSIPLIYDYQSHNQRGCLNRYVDGGEGRGTPPNHVSV